MSNLNWEKIYQKTPKALNDCVFYFERKWSNWQEEIKQPQRLLEYFKDRHSISFQQSNTSGDSFDLKIGDNQFKYPCKNQESILVEGIEAAFSILEIRLSNINSNSWFANEN